MLKSTQTYPLKDVDGEFRFASEFTHYLPENSSSWQAFYFKYFGKGSTEKKFLPFKLNIKRKDHTYAITIIEFVDADGFSSAFFSDYDHLIMIAIVELPKGERVIIPCFWQTH